MSLLCGRLNRVSRGNTKTVKRIYERAPSTIHSSIPAAGRSWKSCRRSVDRGFGTDDRRMGSFFATTSTRYDYSEYRYLVVTNTLNCHIHWLLLIALLSYNETFSVHTKRKKLLVHHRRGRERIYSTVATFARRRENVGNHHPTATDGRTTPTSEMRDDICLKERGCPQTPDMKKKRTFLSYSNHILSSSHCKMSVDVVEAIGTAA